MIELLHELKTAVLNIVAFRLFIMSQLGNFWTSIRNKKLKVFLRTLCAFSILVQQGCQFGFFEARFWNSGCSLNTSGSFWKENKPENSGFFWLIFSQIGLALAKHCLSCILISCILNILRRGSITRQGTQDIAKILLLP